MEFIIGQLPDLEAQKFDCTYFAELLLNFRELLRGKSDLKWLGELYSKCRNAQTAEERKKPLIDSPEMAEPEADIEDVHLRYISDYIRELRTKKDYWKNEFLHWNDIISQKNWKMYDKKVKDHVDRHKHILKNLDKLLQTIKPVSLEDKNYFSQSLDPDRVQNLVTAMKERESEDNPFEAMLKAVDNDNYRGVLVQFAYILYAIYATNPTD